MWCINPPTNNSPAMRKSKAIGLLKIQIEKINDPLIKRDDWISSTTVVLSRVFPVSAEIKIAQIRELGIITEFYKDLPNEKRIETIKKKAATFLNNYIEEIELLGTETSSKMEMFFGSFRFWSILITICLFSFIGGNSLAAGEEIKSLQTSGLKILSLNEELLLRKNEIDSLRQVIKDLTLNLQIP